MAILAVMAILAILNAVEQNLPARGRRVRKLLFVTD
jgi:hypothetical protein